MLRPDDAFAQMVPNCGEMDRMRVQSGSGYRVSLPEGSVKLHSNESYI